MARIPRQSEAVSMVELALKERAADVHQRLQAAGDLAAFSDLYARAMIERMMELDDPGPVLRSDVGFPERVKRISEIRNAAVEQVLAEMLSTESLRAVDPVQPSD